MKKKEVENKILNWFKKKNKKVLIKENFLLNNTIDSFDLINLIVFIEKEFDIKFENHDFSDPNFATIKNITKIVLSYEK
jgi:acyl carrier protein